eukprot:gb/GEZN01019842.1/.p1 GENE.gb/GEZN01019842.1/~~gb/GEZN01019842.1/.p1  ORF type:complete len:161 (+),score=51.46 gb/GEZN01019842.1/:77-559(+)
MNPAAAAALNQQVQEGLVQMRAVSSEIAQLTGPRTKLQTALNENKLVQQELDLLEEEAVIFQMVGPVLIKRDIEEVKQNVKARIGLVQGQMKDVEKQEKELEEKQGKIRDRILSLQQKFKDDQQKAVQQTLAQQQLQEQVQGQFNQQQQQQQQQLPSEGK